jgi:hypothetical protein
MTLPLRADWAVEESYTAEGQNATAEAVNALGAGTLIIPDYVSVISTASFQLTTARNGWVYNGAGTTWTLPTVAGHLGAYLRVYNRGSGSLIVQRSGSDQIYNRSAVTSVTIPAGSSVEFFNDGDYWDVLSKGASLPPAYDGSSYSGGKVNIASATPFTWSHVVTDPSYGIIGVTGVGGFGRIVPGVWTSAAASLGGVSLPLLGVIGMNNSVGQFTDGWLAVFGAPNIPVGTQTASVTLTQTGGATYSGGAVAFTYSGVTQVGSLETDYGLSHPQTGSNTQIDPGPTRMWAMVAAAGGTFADTWTVKHHRQIQSAGNWSLIAGDQCFSSTDEVEIWSDTFGYAGAAYHYAIASLSMKS